jgi:hypothetical protein
MPLPRFLLRLSHRLHARHKFAVLGLVGMLMVATPWVQVLREQAREIEMALDARAALDPAGSAVTLQRGLLAHRPPAHRVLSGQPEAEAERSTRQHEVDHRLAVLLETLRRGHLTSAMVEGSTLREDWKALVRAITTRSVSAAGSDEAHQLLIEQTLQIIDFVARAPEHVPSAQFAGAPPGASLRDLSALEAALSQVEALRLTRRAVELDGAVAHARQALRHATRAAAPAAAGAAAGQAAETSAAVQAQAQQAIERYFARLRAAPQDVAQAAHDAQTLSAACPAAAPAAAGAAARVACRRA